LLFAFQINSKKDPLAADLLHANRATRRARRQIRSGGADCNVTSRIACLDLSRHLRQK